LTDTFRRLLILYAKDMKTVIWNRRIIIFFAIALLLLSSPSFAFSVVAVRSSDLRPYSEAFEGFKSSCDCNTTEIRIETLGGSGTADRILKDSPDAILAIGTEAFKRTRHISRIPVFYMMVVPSELVDPLPRNIRGIAMQMSPEACLTAIREVFPKVTRIGLLYDPAKSGNYVSSALRAAESKGLELITRQIRDISQIPGSLSGLVNNVDVLWMLPDTTFTSPDILDHFFSFSFGSRIPIFTFSRKYVEMGAVASLDVNPYNMGKQIGEMVDSSIKDKRTSEGTYARIGRLIINSKVARKIGLRIRGDVMRKAEDVN